MSDFDNTSASERERHETALKMQLGVNMAASAYAWQRAKQILRDCPDVSAQGLLDILLEESLAAQDRWESVVGDGEAAGEAQSAPAP